MRLNYKLRLRLINIIKVDIINYIVLYTILFYTKRLNVSACIKKPIKYNI